MSDFPGVLCDVHTELDDVSGQDLTGRTLFGPTTQALAVYKGAITALSVLEVELAGLVVEPDERMVPGQHFAVKGGVVLGGSAAGHRASDLDGLIQVNMALLERVRVGSAGEHSQRRRHRFGLQRVAPT